jgi:uncharacterized protein
MSNVDTVRRYFELFNAGRADEGLGLLDPAMVIHEASSLDYGGDHHGHAGFMEVLQRAFALAEFDVRNTDIFDAGDTVVARMHVTITSRHSGQAIDTEIVEIYGFAQGRIADIDVYYKDTEALLEAVPA